MNTLGIHERLKEARKKLNLNQLIIATDLNIHQKTISEIENGKILNIPNTYIYYFFKKGISLDWLYEGIEPMLAEAENASSGTENRSMNVTLENLFDNIKQPEPEKLKPENIIEQESGSKKSDDIFERLIESKDMTIRSLLAYVQSVENNLEFIKGLLVQKK